MSEIRKFAERIGLKVELSKPAAPATVGNVLEHKRKPAIEMDREAVQKRMDAMRLDEELRQRELEKKLDPVAMQNELNRQKEAMGNV